MLRMMRLRDKILFAFLLFAGFAPIYQRFAEFGYVVADGADIINLLLSIIATVLPWYLIIKFGFWIYDKLMKK